MFVTFFKGLKLFVGVTEVDDPRSLIKYDPNLGFVQPLRFGSIITPRHGFYIAYKSRILKGRRIRLPNSVALCLVAGTNQISKALEKVGVEGGVVQVLGVGERDINAIEGRPKEEDVKEIHGTTNEKEIIEKAAITSLTLY